jgi:hypothetical protein
MPGKTTGCNPARGRGGKGGGKGRGKGNTRKKKKSSDAKQPIVASSGVGSGTKGNKQQTMKSKSPQPNKVAPSLAAQQPIVQKAPPLPPAQELAGTPSENGVVDGDYLEVCAECAELQAEELEVLEAIYDSAYSLVSPGVC